MRKLIISLSATMLMILCSATFADSVVITNTKEWKSIPITVDTTSNTYTVAGTVPVESTNYYYTYSGYRCFSAKRSDFVGVNFVIFKAGVGGGSDIYCYPE